MTPSFQPAEYIEATIRFARPSDASALSGLRYALRASTGRANESEPEFRKRCAVWMEEHLREAGPWHCWVAEADQQLIGAVWVQLVEKIPNPRSEPEHHAYLTNFYVPESARGRGVGSQLLQAVLQWCKQRDVHAVILWPTERSRTLYERHGFAVREDIMELVIGAPAAPPGASEVNVEKVR